MLSRLSLTLAATALLFLGGCDRQEPQAPQEVAGDVAPGEIDRRNAGELIPGVPLIHLDGREVNLSAMQGQPILLNLWATWCAPCIKELPLLEELAVDYEGRLRVVTVSQDLEGEAAVAPFWAERGFEQLQPWIDRTSIAMEDLDVDVLPTTILYDESGQEVWRVTGDVDWSSAEIRGAVDEGLAD